MARITWHSLNSGARCKHLSRFMRAIWPVIWKTAVLLLICIHPAMAVPPGTVIRNTAAVTYSTGAHGGLQAFSNTVEHTTVVIRTASQVTLLKYSTPDGRDQALVPLPTWYSSDGSPAGSFIALPQPLSTAEVGPVDLSSPVPLKNTDIYETGSVIFIRVEDHDQNLDATAADSLLVTLTNSATGDHELLRINETGPATGVFLGYLPTVGILQPMETDNGILAVQPASEIRCTYVDAADSSDNTVRTALVDPYGLVFDSSTGQLLDGAAITLIDTTTGRPALVYGDDGISAFPATVISGATASDAGDRSYNFPPGGYRFPTVAAGNYRLQIDSPEGYIAPSAVPSSTLQSLQGGPFLIVEPGSRGEPFILKEGPAFRIDLPLDPASAAFWITKAAGKQQVSVGEFIPYTLEIENLTAATIEGVTVIDRLPHSFRYEAGSVRIDNSVGFEPVISEDGGLLNFSLGSMAPGARRSVRYVAMVGAGARQGRAINKAVVRGARGEGSNTAEAVVEITEDLYRSHCFIVGRVVLNADQSSEIAPHQEQGLQGVRLYLENGTSTITDKQGRYHFHGLKPGTHVVQIDPHSLPPSHHVLQSESTTRSAGRADSRFVDLQPGTLWRADFEVGLKPPQTGQVRLELHSEIANRNMLYRLAIKAEAVPLQNLHLTLMLPDGASYSVGSSRLQGNPAADPKAYDNILVFNLGDASGQLKNELTFQASLPIEGDSRELISKAVLSFDTPTRNGQKTEVISNIVEMSVQKEHVDPREHTMELLPERAFAESLYNGALLSVDSLSDAGLLLTAAEQGALFKLAASLKQAYVEKLLIGYVLRNGQPGGALRQENNHTQERSLAMARAQSAGHYLVKALQLTPSQLIFQGLPPLETGNSSGGPPDQEDRVQSCRVSIQARTYQVKRSVSFNVVAADAHTVAQTVGLRPGETWQSEQQNHQAAADPTQFDKRWLDSASAELHWLWPAPGSVAAISSTKVMIKHPAGMQTALLLNGHPVNPLNYHGTLLDSSGTKALSRWTGIDLQEGDNLFELIVTNKQGVVVDRLTQHVIYPGQPVKAEIVPEKSILIADGQKGPVLALQLRDRHGYPVREGVTGEYSVEPPHAVVQSENQQGYLPLNAPGRTRAKYVVHDDGLARIHLLPTAQSGAVVVRLHLAGGDQTLRCWLQPGQREWILVGLAEGTLGYNTVSGNMENFDAADESDGFYQDGRLAFFAKGKIKGSWLLTLSYDSAKDRHDPDNRMFQEIDPDAYYTLYGDGSRQTGEVASIRKLYVKVERENFYALFGDYETGLTVTELSRYSRRFNGFKTELVSDDFSVNAFASDSRQTFVKDEIRGDGTSGLYRLSRTHIVANSEKIVIETRDRFRTELILSSRPLARHIDYQIDYDDATVFFKFAVPGTDENLNPVIIVATYESENSSVAALNYGGRVAGKMLNQRLELGTTMIHEGPRNGEADLNGIDAIVQLGADTHLKAEAAVSRNNSTPGEQNGDAFLAEVIKSNERIKAKAYYREQAEGFGLSQQNASEQATRKIGLDGAYKLSEQWRLDSQVYRQSNLATGSERDLGEAVVGYTRERYSLSSGLKLNEDRLADGSERQSQLVTGAIARRFMKNKLQIKLAHEQNLSNADAGSDFPTRTILGSDYQISDSVSVFGTQEFAWHKAGTSQQSRLGMKAAPWSGAQVGTSLDRSFAENSDRLAASLGLQQTWQINQRWFVDGGLDRSTTLQSHTDSEFAGHPGSSVWGESGATGVSEDYSAVSLGLGYKVDAWSFNSRIETRLAESEDKWNLLSGAIYEPRPGIGLSTGIQLWKTRSRLNNDSTKGDIRLGMALRPSYGRWTLLDRLEYRFDAIDSQESDTQRLVNNLHLNYRAHAKLQVSLQYGAKYVFDTFYDQTYRGFVDLLGMEMRYDLTPRWDVGLHTNLLHAWRASQYDYSCGVSFGHLVMQNVWVSLGYNLTGFEDEDFSRAAYTAQGPFVRLRIKFDQQTIRDMLK